MVLTLAKPTISECEEPSTELYSNQIRVQFDASKKLIISIVANPLSLSDSVLSQFVFWVIAKLVIVLML